MANEKKKPPVIRRRRRQQEVSGFGPLLIVGMALSAFYSLDASIIMAIGIVPTIVLGFTGKGEFRAEKLQCVGFSNIAGVLPFMVQAKMRGSWDFVVGDIMNLLLMYGSAAIGYALVYVGPLVAAFILQGMNDDRLKKIAAQKQAHVDMWGHEVLGEKEEADPNAGKNFIR